MNAFRPIPAAKYAGDGSTVYWLVENLIIDGGIGLAWGLSGSDKTGAIFDLLVHTHRGIKWRDREVIQVPSVLFVAEGQQGFKNRLKAYAKDRGISLDDLPPVIPTAIDLRREEHIDALIAELTRADIQHIWFDTLQQCTPGADGNSDRDMGEVVSNLKRIAKEIGGFVGVIAHAGKQVSKGPRGSSVWTPAVDLELYLESDGANGSMHVEKCKDAEPGDVFPYVRKIIELGLNCDGKPLTSVVIQHVDTAQRHGSELPRPDSLLRATYDTLARLGLVDFATARKACRANYPAPKRGERDRRAIRAGEDLRELVARRLASMNGDKISTSQEWLNG